MGLDTIEASGFYPSFQTCGIANNKYEDGFYYKHQARHTRIGYEGIVGSSGIRLVFEGSPLSIRRINEACVRIVYLEIEKN
jgi:hypothetical protein